MNTDKGIDEGERREKAAGVNAVGAEKGENINTECTEEKRRTQRKTGEILSCAQDDG
jgi:hypothetical protein